MNDEPKRASWRDVSDSFISIGRALEEIEALMMDVRATGVVDDYRARRAVDKAVSASNRLAKKFKFLQYLLRNER